MRVALYLRRSTVDLQPDSLETQEEILRAFAEKAGHEVIRVFKDSSSGRFVKGRTAFLELIELVKSGPDFEAVLVRDVSRWSRAENTDEAGFYEFICRSNGVQVIYAEENFGTDDSPYNLLLKSVKRAMAAEFSLDRSRLISAAAARTVRRGFWPTGPVPYGMRRALVGEDGTLIRILEPGERKVIAGHRIKLTPGDPGKVAIVSRIFRAFGEDHQSLDQISRALNTEGIPSSHGSVWTPGMISHVLRNEAYAGNLVYRKRAGLTRSGLRNLDDADSDHVARCDGAHPAIVSAELWQAVKDQFAAVSSRKTDSQLMAELSAARLRWHPDRKAPREIVTAGEIRGTYGATDRAVIGTALEHANVALFERLGKRFHLTEFDGGWVLDHLIHVGTIVSLPHARFGGLHWQFEFTGKEREDLILGLGFSPPPRVEHVETFSFRIRQSTNRRHSARPPLFTTSRTEAFVRIRDDEALFRVLAHAIRYRSTRAEKLFRAAIQGSDRINFAEVAAKLGWPVSAARSVYGRLDLRGERLPAVDGERSNTRIKVICPHCLRPRWLRPKVVIGLETDVCFECLHRPPARTPNHLVAICPTCGARRLLAPSKVAARSAGVDSLCGDCSRRSFNATRATIARERRTASR